jgi:hypothetical protein
VSRRSFILKGADYPHERADFTVCPDKGIFPACGITLDDQLCSARFKLHLFHYGCKPCRPLAPGYKGGIVVQSPDQLARRIEYPLQRNLTVQNMYGRSFFFNLISRLLYARRPLFAPGHGSLEDIHGAVKKRLPFVFAGVELL